MTAKIFDARKGCSIKGRRFLFDTNVWIAIDGNDPRPHARHYSDFYGDVLKSDNEIVVNDYIIGEYFNRTCRIQYDLVFEDDKEKKLYKRRRSNAEFEQFIESVRDTCLNIIDECTFEPAFVDPAEFSSFIKEAGDGSIDLTDIVVREHCRRNGYILVSDDGDFRSCGVDLVTANRRLLSGT